MLNTPHKKFNHRQRCEHTHRLLNFFREKFALLHIIAYSAYFDILWCFKDLKENDARKRMQKRECLFIENLCICWYLRPTCAILLQIVFLFESYWNSSMFLNRMWFHDYFQNLIYWMWYINGIQKKRKQNNDAKLILNWVLRKT